MSQLSQLVEQLQRPIALVTLAGEDGDEFVCLNTEMLLHACCSAENTIFIFMDTKTEKFIGMQLINTKLVTKALEGFLRQSQADSGARYAQSGPGLFSGAANSETDAPLASANQNTL